jgi:hypothetical protein
MSAVENLEVELLKLKQELAIKDVIINWLKRKTIGYDKTHVKRIKRNENRKGKLKQFISYIQNKINEIELQNVKEDVIEEDPILRKPTRGVTEESEKVEHRLQIKRQRKIKIKRDKERDKVRKEVREILDGTGGVTEDDVERLTNVFMGPPEDQIKSSIVIGTNSGSTSTDGNNIIIGKQQKATQ